MFKRLLNLVPPCCSLLAGAIVAAWVVSRLATDRWIFTQLMFWVPSPLYLGPAVALALAGAIPLRRQRRGRMSAAALLTAVAALAWLFLFEWRLPRALAMPDQPVAARSLRVIHWNMASVDESFRPTILAELAGPEGADVFLLGVLLDNKRLNEAIARLGPGYVTRRYGCFAIVSRVAIDDMTVESLAIPTPGILAEETITGSSPAPGSGPFRLPLVQKFYNRASRYLGFQRRDLAVGDPGSLVRFRLDTTMSLGRPTDVWWIDLPSSPLAPRYALARVAAERLSNIRARPGAAAPDLFLGDFNIPRGSASIDLVVRATGESLTHAFDQASYGPVGSWPARRPLWLIDNLFTAPTLRVARYRLLNAGISEHRAQDAVLVPAAPLPRHGP